MQNNLSMNRRLKKYVERIEAIIEFEYGLLRYFEDSRTVGRILKVIRRLKEVGALFRELSKMPVG